MMCNGMENNGLGNGMVAMECASHLFSNMKRWVHKRVNESQKVRHALLLFASHALEPCRKTGIRQHFYCHFSFLSPSFMVKCTLPVDKLISCNGRRFSSARGPSVLGQNQTPCANF